MCRRRHWVCTHTHMCTQDSGWTGTTVQADTRDITGRTDTHTSGNSFTLVPSVRHGQVWPVLKIFKKKIQSSSTQSTAGLFKEESSVQCS